MDDFLCGLTGHVILPFDPLYNEARQGFNSAVQKYPLIIDYCRNNKDVSNAVIWSETHGVPIRIRSGGHNYEGYSNGNCTLVIDISRMNTMELNEDTNELHVQAGVTNMQVYKFVSSKGYPFPGGTCPTVGVSGFALGGGWGLSCRNFGLGCDNVLQIEMINYEGKLIKANKFENPDLFWACRGAGGGNFGVVVAMTFKLPPKVNMVTLIEIDYLHVSSKEQEQFLKTWQRWLKTANDRISLISRIYNSENDGLSMLVRGIFYGEKEEAERIMEDFLELRGDDYNFEYIPFLEAVEIIGSSYPPSEKFQSASRFVYEEFNDCDIKDIVELIRQRPEGSVFAGISMYTLGGKVARVGTQDTAFFYRHSKYIIWLETIWENNRYATENKRWIEKQFPYIRALTKGSYVNFPYSELNNYLEEYYGSHVKMLKKIKRKYDPFNVFSFPQGIVRAKAKKIPFYSIPELFDVIESKINKTSGECHRGFRYVSKKNE